MLVGYEDLLRIYRVWSFNRQSIITVSSVRFDEDIIFPQQELRLPRGTFDTNTVPIRNPRGRPKLAIVNPDNYPKDRTAKHAPSTENQQDKDYTDARVKTERDNDRQLRSTSIANPNQTPQGVHDSNTDPTDKQRVNSNQTSTDVPDSGIAKKKKTRKLVQVEVP